MIDQDRSGFYLKHSRRRTSTTNVHSGIYWYKKHYISKPSTGHRATKCHKYDTNGARDDMGTMTESSAGNINRWAAQRCKLPNMETSRMFPAIELGFACINDATLVTATSFETKLWQGFLVRENSISLKKHGTTELVTRWLKAMPWRVVFLRKLSRLEHEATKSHYTIIILAISIICDVTCLIKFFSTANVVTRLRANTL